MSYKTVTELAGEFNAKGVDGNEYTIETWDQFYIVRVLAPVKPRKIHRSRYFKFKGIEVDYVSPGHLRIVGGHGNMELTSDDPLARPYDEWRKMMGE